MNFDFRSHKKDERMDDKEVSKYYADALTKPVSKPLYLEYVELFYKAAVAMLFREEVEQNPELGKNVKKIWEDVCNCQMTLSVNTHADAESTLMGKFLSPMFPDSESLRLFLHGEKKKAEEIIQQMFYDEGEEAC